MDDRVDGRVGVEHQEPSTRARGFNLALRYSGIVFPWLAGYLGVFAIGGGRSSSVWMAALLAAVLWLIPAVWLAIRRDWAGAAAVTVVYAFTDAWLWLVVAGVIDLG